MATIVSTSPVPSNMMNTNKRKRGNEDLDRKAIRQNSEQNNDYASLLQGLDATGNEESTRTAQAALAGTMGDQPYPDPGFDTSGMSASFDSNAAAGMGGPQNAPGIYGTPTQAGNKPGVGTPEWHESRKANHKEVERRRREVINEGIENIAKIVPGGEKNKGAILQRTAQYIQEQQAEISKFDNERATFDIALKELTSRNDRLKESLRQSWEESKKWQKRCRDAGLQFDDYDGQMGEDSYDEADLEAAIGA